MALVMNPALVIADEPTTALDVTIQAQILELLKSLRADFDMAVIFVTHDLGVVADIADRIVVMYAGQVVERRDVHDLFRSPAHPYAEGLLASMPQVATLGQPLTVIPGVVPRPGEITSGCRFASRCSYADDKCRNADVPLRPVTKNGAGEARCARADELTLTGTRWAQARDEIGTAAARPPIDTTGTPQLSVRELCKSFPVHSSFLQRVIGHVRAVDGIDFDIYKGETLGLVGESGSGKSTVARLVLRLLEPTAGVVELDGRNLVHLSPGELRVARSNMQIVFQDPYSSLDPRRTVADTIGEPLEVHLGLGTREREERIAGLLEQVGLDRELMRRYPHEFSGGQRQRIAIARALALDPELVICDEPVSSLDVSTQSQVINLLMDLQHRHNHSYLFIAHDLSVVRHISNRIAVMYLGRIVEIGTVETVYETPRHPYTKALLSAQPRIDFANAGGVERILLKGEVPSPARPPSGCRFRTRCWKARALCAEQTPALLDDGPGHRVACHFPVEPTDTLPDRSAG
jgi:peptide/nickel transport system ATP-binding protein